MPSLVPNRATTGFVCVVIFSSPRESRSELDLDVDVSRQVESHQRINGLRRRVNYVDEALMCAHLKVLAAVLVLMRRANDAEYVLRSEEHTSELQSRGHLVCR